MAIYIGDPAGLTWVGARAKVRGDLWRPGNSLPDDNVDRALHASVLELEGECKWLWLENLTTVVTIDEPAAFLDLPPVIGRVSALAIRRDEWADDLTERTLPDVRRGAPGSLGDASAYAFGDGKIWFDSTMNGGTELEMVFTAQTPERLEDALVSGSITLQRQQQAIIANACAIVALTFMKNAEEAARQRAVYDRIVERLLNVEAERRGGAIVPDTWGMGCG